MMMRKPTTMCVCVQWITLLLVVTSVGDIQAAAANNTVERYLKSNAAAGNKPNSLIDQVSPYLLQHAYNPVQWHAWGEQAFELAREQDKPIFLSIGYSTCYWCHVMAHESFENEKIAAILNTHFISIKLDREERPEIDNVYMAATELLNGYGGWPMTVFLNHELEPFHAGVYYPPETTDNSTGLTELLIKVADLWREDRNRIEMIAEQVALKIKADADQSMAAVAIDGQIHQLAMEQVTDIYDDEYAGFGVAPKFPRPGIFRYLLELSAAEQANSEQALQMVRDTLVAMSQGGIFDQVGGGFHRYSVDQRWQVPHFEKMLYTQALMSLAYTRLYELEPEPRYRDVAIRTLDFVLAEMRHPEGAFYSALDASSARPDQPDIKAEGAYYLWREAELRTLLDKEEWSLVRKTFDIRDNGNIESDPRAEFEQLNILSVSDDFKHSALDKSGRALLGNAMRKLAEQRSERPRPHLDDKVISAWNGMMIRALVEAARVYHARDYLDAAVAAAGFMQDELVDGNTGTLFRRLRKDEAGIDATLDDYAWYVNGLLALYGFTNDSRWLSQALQLTARQVELFHEADLGGFYESGADRNVLFRSRSAYDGALPSANAVAVENLLLLANYSGDEKWRRMANATIAAFTGSINNDPVAAGWMLSLINNEKLIMKNE
jgi:uncharacterized protein YyaL (SSP411 family)